MSEITEEKKADLILRQRQLIRLGKLEAAFRNSGIEPREGCVRELVEALEWYQVRVDSAYSRSMDDADRSMSSIANGDLESDRGELARQALAKAGEI